MTLHILYKFSTKPTNFILCDALLGPGKSLYKVKETDCIGALLKSSDNYWPEAQPGRNPANNPARSFRAGPGCAY